MHGIGLRAVKDGAITFYVDGQIASLEEWKQAELENAEEEVQRTKVAHEKALSDLERVKEMVG